MLRLARYEVIESLGRGGTSRVVRVRDREDPGRALVAKVLSAAIDPSELEAEFALLARVRMPGLVRAHDFGRDNNGATFLVEDFVEAIDVGAFAQSTERARRWLIDVLVTIAGLHEAGFVHGDVKPAHVRLQSNGRSIFVDLGCALASRRGGGDRRAGSARAHPFTPAYAAPEVIAGAAPDARADLFGIGATFYALVGAAPEATRERQGAARTSALRRVAPWLAPSIAEVVSQLVAPHPADRPADAHDALARLGEKAQLRWEEGGFPCVGRENAIATLLARRGPSVRYVAGPSGAGKSHALREAALRALTMGWESRVLRFPLGDAERSASLIAYLRSEGVEHPFFVRRREGRPLLVVLDDLQRAPAELHSALDAFRCRVPDAADMWIVAGVREAPKEASVTTLGPLDTSSFAALCRELGVRDDAEMEKLAATSARLPGWLVAALGKVPLSRDGVLQRLRGLPEDVLCGAFAIALHDGSIRGSAFDRVFGESENDSSARANEAFAALARLGLVTRRDGNVELGSPHLAADLATSLSTFERAERVGAALLRDGAALPRALLRAATAETPPANRAELLRRAVERARATGERQAEIDALFALASVATERTPDRVLRLERLTRDSGQSRTHPEVLRWLDDVAKADDEVAALAIRRKAELAAREGRIDDARTIAMEAVRASPKSSLVEGYALATEGTVAVYRGDYGAADVAFERASSLLGAKESLGESIDREELARLDHNRGIVALARGRVGEAVTAFERAVARKRALGDPAGVRSSLLNLGLGLAKLGDFAPAERVFGEAIRLAQVLGQKGGLAWCLAARADLEVRRGAATSARKFVDEAASLGDVVPAVVRADLAILRAEIALLDGSGALARAAVDSLDPSLRQSDALIDARALAIEGRAALATLPVDRRAAAKLAVRAARRARTADLPEAEEAALRVLEAARGRNPRVNEAVSSTTAAPAARLRYDSGMPGDALPILEDFAGGGSPESALRKLLATVRARVGAERAFLVGSIAAPSDARVVYGVDVDDDLIVDAARKLEWQSSDEAPSAIFYERDLPTRAGRGSRLVSVAANTALVFEHRFRTSAFDSVRAEELRDWNIVAGVIVRSAIRSAEAEAQPAPAASDRHSHTPNAGYDATTTSVPLRERRREFANIVGASGALSRALAKLDAAVDSDLPVVLTGETGTGKELFARALHDYGRRSSRPFVAVNCAAIADALFEAELFGHARGAFTGAERARPGLLLRAEGGTLFLDEVAELSLARQATLLRVLETRMVRPVGSDEERPFDVRIVCATHADLDVAVRDGKFRADLLYRLRVLSVEVPALRDRDDDVVVLARSFMRKAGSRASFAKSVDETLRAYDWPGNVRELAHVVERLAILEVDRIEVRHLPRALRAGRTSVAAVRPENPRDDVAVDPRAEIERALALTSGNITHAANALGITRHGLKKRMLRLGLRRKEE